MTNTNRTAIENLRTFALNPDNVPRGQAHDRLSDRDHMVAFAHLCNAALPGWLYFNEKLWPVAERRYYGITLMQDFVDASGSYRTIPVVDLELYGSEIAGEAWAVERIAKVIENLDFNMSGRDSNNRTECETIWLDCIRATDTTRPDGAIARSVEV